MAWDSRRALVITISVEEEEEAEAEESSRTQKSVFFEQGESISGGRNRFFYLLAAAPEVCSAVCMCV